jgi:hypothetical protein
LYDILGKEIITLSDIKTREFKVEKGNLPSGVYFYKVSNDKKMISKGKILIK